VDINIKQKQNITKKNYIVMLIINKMNIEILYENFIDIYLLSSTVNVASLVNLMFYQLLFL